MNAYPLRSSFSFLQLSNPVCSNTWKKMNLFSFFEDLSSSSESTESSDVFETSNNFRIRTTNNFRFGCNHNRFRSTTGNGIMLQRRAGVNGNRRGLYEIEKGLYSTNPRFRMSRLRKATWRIVLLIMGLFFFAAAYVQHNDPDPYLWMPVYIVPLCVNVNLMISIPIGNWSCLNKIIHCHLAYCYTLGFWTMAYFIHGKVTGADSLFLEPDMFAEEAKELLGLCLVIAWLSFVSNGNFLRFGGKGVILGMGLTILPIIIWVFLDEIEASGMYDTCN